MAYSPLVLHPAPGGKSRTHLARAILAGFAWAVTRSIAAFDCEGLEPSDLGGMTLELVTEGLSRPVDIAAPPGEAGFLGDSGVSGRLFVAEQNGRIVIVDLATSTLRSTPFLDIRSRVRCCGELGLLGFAFHPDWAEPDRAGHGTFFVYYTRAPSAPSACQAKCRTNCEAESVIARYRVSAVDPNIADSDSEEILLTVGQPFSNHNAGQLAFSPVDGYLYIALGDGGSGGDPCGSGQDPESLLGKLLRIDVDVDATAGALPYAIPPDNPFVGVEGVRPEIWALGLRNPWRCSFDPETGDLYIADVGQNQWEEINFQPASSSGGENYEWRAREGLHSFSGGTAFGPGERRAPIHEYSHSGPGLVGCSVTGGVVYRGCSMPWLRGTYFFAEYCSDWVSTLRVVDGVVAELTNRTAQLNDGIRTADVVDEIVAFGVDGRGEIYLCDHPDKLFRIVSAPPPNVPPNAVLRSTPAPALVTLSGGTATVEFDATDSDDGGEGNQTLGFTWRVTPSAAASIDDPNLGTTTIRFSSPGNYVVRVTVTDGEDSATARLDVTVAAGLAAFDRGDSNSDGAIDISDGISTLLALFVGTQLLVCDSAADVDDNGKVEITDAIATFGYLFLGGVPPRPPFAGCDSDPTPDDLECATQPSCADSN
jgi:glucose/arabinose dehydrogenase